MSLVRASVVAFIPAYDPGGTCGCHQDDEPEMAHEWIVSVSFGASAPFRFSSSRQGPFQEVVLKELSVFAMSRMLWHQVGPAAGSQRWNLTFRCWQTADPLPPLVPLRPPEVPPAPVACQFPSGPRVPGCLDCQLA